MSEMLRNGTTCLIVLMLAPVLLADDASQTDKATKKPTELSVAPLDQIDFPDSRPKWVGSSVEFNDEADTIIVVSGPCETPEESLEELKLMQRAAVSTYISRKTKSGSFDFFPISDEDIERDLVIRSYEGEVVQGGMTRYEHAVELKFTEDKQESIQHAWKQVEVRDRLGALGVLGFLGTTMLICSSLLIGTVSRRIERSTG
jgi:hypothetical protein